MKEPKDGKLETNHINSKLTKEKKSHRSYRKCEKLTSTFMIMLVKIVINKKLEVEKQNAELPIYGSTYRKKMGRDSNNKRERGFKAFSKKSLQRETSKSAKTYQMVT